MPGGGLEAEFLLALMTLAAEFVPAVEVEVAVFGDVLGEGLEGEMRGGVSEVGEEGGGLVMGGVVLEVGQEVIGDGDGAVEAGVFFDGREGLIVFEE